MLFELSAFNLIINIIFFLKAYALTVDIFYFIPLAIYNVKLGFTQLFGFLLFV